MYIVRTQLLERPMQILLKSTLQSDARTSGK